MAIRKPAKLAFDPPFHLADTKIDKVAPAAVTSFTCIVAGCAHMVEAPSQNTLGNAASDWVTASIDPSFGIYFGDATGDQSPPAIPAQQTDANAVKTDFANSVTSLRVAEPTFTWTILFGNHDAGDGNYDWAEEAYQILDYAYYRLDKGNLIFHLLNDRNSGAAPEGRSGGSGGFPSGFIADATFKNVIDYLFKYPDKTNILCTHQGVKNSTHSTAPATGGVTGEPDWSIDTPYHGISGIKGAGGYLCSVGTDRNTNKFNLLYEMSTRLVQAHLHGHTHAGLDQTEGGRGNKATIGNTLVWNIKPLSTHHEPGPDEASTRITVTGTTMDLDYFVHDSASHTNGQIAVVFNTEVTIPVTYSSIYSSSVPSVPGVPTGFSATPTSSQITISWTLPATTGTLVIRRRSAAPTGVPAANTSYWLGDAIGDGEVVFVGLGSVNSFIDRDVEPLTTYHYAIYAVDGGGGQIKYSATALTGNSRTASKDVLAFDFFQADDTGGNASPYNTGEWTLTDTDGVFDFPGNGIRLTRKSGSTVTEFTNEFRSTVASTGTHCVMWRPTWSGENPEDNGTAGVNYQVALTDATNANRIVVKTSNDEDSSGFRFQTWEASTKIEQYDIPGTLATSGTLFKLLYDDVTDIVSLWTWDDDVGGSGRGEWKELFTVPSVAVGASLDATITINHNNESETHELTITDLVHDNADHATPFQIATGDRAYDLNGTTQGVDFGDVAAANFGDATTDSPFSISCQARIDSLDRLTFFGRQVNTTAGNVEYHFGTDASGFLQIWLYDNTSSVNIKAVADVALSVDTTYWLGMTYDGSGLNTGLTLYVDGAVRASTAGGAGSYTAMHDTNVDVHIGLRNRDAGTPRWSNMVINNVKVYNDELTANEMQYLHTEGASGTDPTTANLVMDVDCADTDNVICTEKHNGYHGTLLGETDAMHFEGTF